MSVEVETLQLVKMIANALDLVARHAELPETAATMRRVATRADDLSKEAFDKHYTEVTGSAI